MLKKAPYNKFHHYIFTYWVAFAPLLYSTRNKNIYEYFIINFKKYVT